jgi:hypothetical protein
VSGMTTRGTRPVQVLLAAVLALSLAGCAGSDGIIHPSPVTASPWPSQTAVSPGPTPPLLTDVSQLAPTPALLVTTQQGTGEQAIDLSVFATGEHKVAIRLACVGSTGLRLEDLSGGVVMGVDWCDSHAIYSADFTSGPKDRQLRLKAAPEVTWAIAVWES